MVDDNFIGNKRRAKELLTAMVEWGRAHGRPFSYLTEASLNLADDPELLQLMKDAGFSSVFLGIETPDESSLIANHKMQNTRRDLLESVQIIQQYGIEVMGGFILGFDTDREDVFDRMVEFIQKSAIPVAMVGLLQAMPGTQLFRRLWNEGRILDAGDGDNTDCKLNFIPRMDAARLVEGYRSVMRRIYSHEAYYERVQTVAQPMPSHPYRALHLGKRARVFLFHRAPGNAKQRPAQLLAVRADHRPAVSALLRHGHDAGRQGIPLPDHDRAPAGAGIMGCRTPSGVYLLMISRPTTVEAMAMCMHMCRRTVGVCGNNPMR